MNPYVKALWVDALRSGDYDQGQGLLREVDGGYCCLGVLCDLAVKNGIIPEPEVTRGLETVDGITDAFVYGTVAEDGETFSTRENAVYLPVEVQDWSGVSKHGDRMAADGSVSSLAVLNDEGKSFEYIADIIELEF